MKCVTEELDYKKSKRSYVDGGLFRRLVGIFRQLLSEIC